MLIDTWRKLPADDPRNVDFDKAAAMLQLGEAHRRLLRSAGVSNLAGIANALRVAPEIERQNAEVQRIRALFKNRKIEGTPDPVKFSVTAKDGVAILGAIGSGLGGARR